MTIFFDARGAKPDHHHPAGRTIPGRDRQVIPSKLTVASSSTATLDGTAGLAFLFAWLYDELTHRQNPDISPTQ
jgi:hypothetical protein